MILNQNKEVVFSMSYLFPPLLLERGLGGEVDTMLVF